MPCHILLLNHLVWHSPDRALCGHNSGMKAHSGTGINSPVITEAGIMQIMKGLASACLPTKTGVKLETVNSRGAAYHAGGWPSLLRHGCFKDPGWVSRNRERSRVQKCVSAVLREVSATKNLRSYKSLVMLSLLCCCCCQK